jgi:hypothetical protein
VFSDGKDYCEKYETNRGVHVVTCVDFDRNFSSPKIKTPEEFIEKLSSSLEEKESFWFFSLSKKTTEEVYIFFFECSKRLAEYGAEVMIELLPFKKNGELEDRIPSFVPWLEGKQLVSWALNRDRI